MAQLVGLFGSLTPRKAAQQLQLDGDAPEGNAANLPPLLVHASVAAVLAWRYAQLLTALPKRWVLFCSLPLVRLMALLKWSRLFDGRAVILQDLHRGFGLALLGLLSAKTPAGGAVLMA